MLKASIFVLGFPGSGQTPRSRSCLTPSFLEGRRSVLEFRGDLGPRDDDVRSVRPSDRCAGEPLVAARNRALLLTSRNLEKP